MLAQPEGFLFPTLSTSEEFGTQPGQLTQIGQRDIPQYIATCLVIKSGVEEEERTGGGFLGGQCSETGWASVYL